MADTRITPETNGIRYGLFTAVGMILYFLVASLLKLIDRIEFSFLNAIILAVGICMAIANYKRYRHDRMPYLHGFGTGIITAMVASLAFGLFFIIYAGVLNPHIMDGIRAADLFGFDLSVTIAFLAILLQGAMSGVIIALIAMQYYKSPDHKPITGIE
jgi:drug/metabolite transporter (DMT)-like permease